MLKHRAPTSADSVDFTFTSCTSALLAILSHHKGTFFYSKCNTTDTKKMGF